MKIIGTNSYADNGLTYSIPDDAMKDAITGGNTRNPEWVNMYQHTCESLGADPRAKLAFTIYAESDQYIYIGAVRGVSQQAVDILGRAIRLIS